MLKLILFFLLVISMLQAQEKEPELVPDTIPQIPEISPQPTVTNYFYETDLLEVLRAISTQTGIQIITDGTVSGIISLEIIELPFEECLKRILFPLGFAFKRIDDYYLVGSAKPDYNAFASLTRTEIIKPNYIKAVDVNKLVSDYYNLYIKVNPEINVIAITASDQIIEKFKEDLAQIDKPPKQVLIEALVTEISTDALRSLGIDWSGKVIGKQGDTILSILTNVAKIADTTLGLYFRMITKSLGGLAYSFVPSIQALVQEGKATIRANPRIVTLDGQPANILVGRELFYQMVSGTEPYLYYRLEVIKIGVSLSITPYISNTGEITLKVEPEVSDVTGQLVADLPIISKRSVKTQIRVKDGERIVIGGLLTKNERIVQRKIPLLGSIPILGFLFRTNRRIVEENEVVVFITPFIL